MIVFPTAANKARSNVLDALELLDLCSRVSAEWGISIVKPTSDKCMDYACERLFVQVAPDLAYVV